MNGSPRARSLLLSLACAAVVLVPAAAHSQIQLQLKLKPSATLSVTGAPNKVVQLQWRSDLSTNGRWLHVDHCVLSNAPSVLALPGLPATENRFYRAVETPSTNLVLIPGCAFTMGNTFSAAEGFPEELPLHTSYVSGVFMDKYEVTKALWDDVYNWATNHSYSFGTNAPGKAANHPAHSMNWHDAVKWCNARSEKESRLTAYYTDAGLTIPYRSGQSAPFVNWTRGYRLPTEAEWEKAARGGAAGHRFPWSASDTIDHNRANYYSSWSLGAPQYPYDVNPTTGLHPAFNVAPEPFTSPVVYFASNANGYGLYDMAGNVWELCWDWYDTNWYSQAGASLADTRGPASGTTRVMRGGAYNISARGCRTAFRGYVDPAEGGLNVGFRCVLPPSP